MPEVFSIAGAPMHAPAPKCPVGWTTTKKGYCAGPGGKAAKAALVLQNALRALGRAARDTALAALAVDGVIGPGTAKAVNRAFTVHIGAGQAAAGFRTGRLTPAQIANSAGDLAAIATAEATRRGGTVPLAPSPASAASRPPAKPRTAKSPTSAAAATKIPPAAKLLKPYVVPPERSGSAPAAESASKLSPWTGTWISLALSAITATTGVVRMLKNSGGPMSGFLGHPLGQTRKDFQAMANILCQHGASPGLIDDIASYFKAANPRFDRDRFTQAVRVCIPIKRAA